MAWTSLTLALVFNVMTSLCMSHTIVVVLDERIVEENSNIPDILQRSDTLNILSQSSTDIIYDPIITSNSSEIISKLCEHLEHGVVAVLDFSTRAISQLLRSFCDVYGIAYVPALDLSYFDEETRTSNNTMIFVEPPDAQMLNVVAAVARHDELKTVAIVYDDTFDIENTPRRLLTNVPAQHMYIKTYENDTKLIAHINNLMKLNMRNVFLIASRSKAQRFLSQMYEEKGKNFDPNIFVLTKDYSLTCDRCEGSDNLLLLTAKTKDRFSRFRDYLNTSGIDQDFQPERIKVDEAFVFDTMVLLRNAVGRMPSISPIVFSQCHVTPADRSVQQSQNLIKTLSEISIMGVFGPMSFDKSYGAIRYNMTLQIQKMDFSKGHVTLASWSDANGLVLEPNVSTLIVSEKRKTYRIVTVVGVPPFMFKDQSSNSSGNEAYQGYCKDLLKQISTELNFDYEIHDVETIGEMDSKGEWSGAIKELMDNKADIAVGPISVMAERENVIDFTVPYYDLVGLTILMKKPGYDYSLVRFLSVLDEKVWGCIIGAFVLFSILISLFDRLSPFSYQNQRSKWNGDGAEPRIFTLKEGVWFCMMSLTPQGGGETPRALSGRLVAATWWLFGFIIIATYTANLAAFLTVSRLETAVDSLDSLSGQFKVEYAPQKGSIASTYFTRMAHIERRFYEIWKNMSLDDNLGDVERAKLAVWDYPVSDRFSKLLETMTKSKFPATKEEAIQRVLKGNFAFIADSTTNKYQAKINCDLVEVGEEFSRKPYALAVQEGSPLRSELSNVILALINQRKLEELKTQWWQLNQKECPKVEDESDGISIRNIGGVFLVIVIGSGFSLVALAFECYWYRLRPGAKTLSTKKKGHSKQMKVPKSASVNKKEVDDNNTNRKKESGGLDSNFVSILDAGYTNNAFEIVERL